MPELAMLPPALSTMRQVPDDEICEYREGRQIVSALKRLGMHCMNDNQGQYWFGMLDATFPDHDRWFLMVPEAKLSRAKSWEDTTFFIVKPCERGLELADLLLSVPQVLQDMEAEIHEALVELGETDLTSARRRKLQLHALMAYQAYGYLGIDFNEAYGALWGQQLHDIVHHWDEWASCNENGVLGQDLIIRMHGLSVFADLRADGLSLERKWNAEEPSIMHDLERLRRQGAAHA